jgi:type III pantothenate kinase
VTPAVVVDIGNSRMKWGRVSEGKIVETLALPLDSPVEWKRHLEGWEPTAEIWLIAGVVPKVIVRFCDWLTSQHVDFHVLDSERLLSIVDDFRTKVEEPANIGIDRLLGAYAAIRIAGFLSTVVAISVGTAMTIDFVENDGTHIGGVILPGPRLMAKSLHDSTAQLPLIDFDVYSPLSTWGQNTRKAIELGIVSAILGAADRRVWEWTQKSGASRIFITGGDRHLFHKFEFAGEIANVAFEETLVLQGLVFAAECLP